MLFPFGTKFGIFQLFVIIGLFIIKVLAEEHPEYRFSENQFHRRGERVSSHDRHGSEIIFRQSVGGI